ncbi:hypothetical protein JJD41_16980 [Oxynema sp. CENA135]|uniref:hypothetical protein n=1 Tax=Oxynema sp. CENA135 TaxID=984206 RepID=UPI00190928AD|nr:hypothetical protein [Oxynema sp. CENA135]MBK4731546.1 hypothetical protein [Oxynema sp. CENA135]
MLKVKGIAIAVAALVGSHLGFTVIPQGLSSDNVEVAIAERRLVMDENGDYYSAGTGPRLAYEWQVVDPDPNGLNCRYYNRRRGPNGRDIYEYPVGTTFQEGELIKSAMIQLDNRGLPWLWIGTSATTEICYVRANSRYVQPVRPLHRGY